jgi:hypothetical protein
MAFIELPLDDKDELQNIIDHLEQSIKKETTNINKIACLSIFKQALSEFLKENF